MLKNSSRSAVSVSINLSIKLSFVSVNGPREAYFVDAIRSSREKLNYISSEGRRVIGISGSLIWSKTLMELIFNPCAEFR